MDQSIRFCDKKDCKTSSSSQQAIYRFSVFVERKADAAGGMENWYAQFDLCPAHNAECLKELFKDFENGAKIVDFTGWLKNREIAFILV